MLWLLKFYVVSPRLTYLITWDDSFLDLTVFLPILLISDPNPFFLSYAFITLSRFIRIIIFTKMFQHQYPIGETDVDRQIINVIIIIFLLLYISSGTFTNIENANAVYIA